MYSMFLYNIVPIISPVASISHLSRRLSKNSSRAFLYGGPTHLNEIQDDVQKLKKEMNKNNLCKNKRPTIFEGDK